MMTVIDATDVPVRKTITVNVSTERAFNQLLARHL